MTTPTGIAGNTQQQQVTATTARSTSVNKSIYWITNVGIAVAFIGIGVILTNTNLGFAWKLIVAFALIYLGGKLGKVKLPASMTPFIWPGILRSAGWLVLIVVLLFSGFGELGRLWANKAETAAKSAAETGVMFCSTDRIVIKAGDKITVSRDCPVVLNQINMRDTSFRFELVDTNLQATAKDEQYISFTQEFPGKEGPHDVMLIPQRSMYDAVGKTELEIIITTPKVIRAPLGSLKPGAKPAPVLDPNKIN